MMLIQGLTEHLKTDFGSCQTIKVYSAFEPAETGRKAEGILRDKCQKRT